MAKKTKDLETDDALEKAIIPENEQPHKIPSNWVWVRLDYLLLEIKNGTTIKQDKSSNGYSVTRIESLQNNTIDFNRLGRIVDEKKIREVDWYKKNDIALSHINSAEHVGKTALIEEHMLPIVHGMNLLRLRFKKVYSPNLFQLYSQTYQYKKSIIDRINMAVNQVSINQKQLGSLEIPVPPISEQLRIIDRIDSIFNKLEQAKALVLDSFDSFELRKAAILSKAFRGELTKKWRNENGLELDSWSEIHLGDLLHPMVSTRPSKSNEYFRYIDIDAIDNTLQQVKEPKKILVSEAPSRASRKVENGNVLFSMVRPYLKNIAYISEDLSDCIASTGFYVCRCKETIRPKFLYYTLCSQDNIDYLNSFMKGDNSPSIRKDHLEGLTINLPSIDEQDKIIELVGGLLDNEQNAKELCDLIETIDLMKKAVLARAFRGELGTNNPEEGIAVELMKSLR